MGVCKGNQPIFFPLLLNPVHMSMCINLYMIIIPIHNFLPLQKTVESIINVQAGLFDKAVALLRKADNASKIDINKVDESSGMVLLHLAAAGGALELVAELLAREVNIAVQSRDGNNALHYAALNERKGIIEILLRSGLSASVPNNAGLLPVEMTQSGDVRALFLRDRSNIFSPVVQSSMQRVSAATASAALGKRIPTVAGAVAGSVGDGGDLTPLGAYATPIRKQAVARREQEAEGVTAVATNLMQGFDREAERSAAAASEEAVALSPLSRSGDESDGSRNSGTSLNPTAAQYRAKPDGSGGYTVVGVHSIRKGQRPSGGYDNDDEAENGSVDNVNRHVADVNYSLSSPERVGGTGAASGTNYEKLADRSASNSNDGGGGEYFLAFRPEEAGGASSSASSYSRSKALYTPVKEPVAAESSGAVGMGSPSVPKLNLNVLPPPPTDPTTYMNKSSAPTLNKSPESAGRGGLGSSGNSGTDLFVDQQRGSIESLSSGKIAVPAAIPVDTVGFYNPTTMTATLVPTPRTSRSWVDSPRTATGGAAASSSSAAKPTVPPLPTASPKSSISSSSSSSFAAPVAIASTPPSSTSKMNMDCAGNATTPGKYSSKVGGGGVGSTPSAPLMAAVLRASQETAQCLQWSDAEYKVRHDLIRACESGKDEKLPKLLKFDPTLASCRVIGFHSLADDGWTPIHVAAKFNRPAIIAQLLELGRNGDNTGPPSVCMVDLQGRTPLHIAAANNSGAAAQVLRAAMKAELNGVDPVGPNAPLDLIGATPLGYAKRRAHFAKGDMEKELFSPGDNSVLPITPVKNRTGKSPWKSGTPHKSNPNATANAVPHGTTPGGSSLMDDFNSAGNSGKHTATANNDKEKAELQSDSRDSPSLQLAKPSGLNKNNSDICASLNETITFGFSEANGWNSVAEDRVLVRCPLCDERPAWSLFAVCDGHGGSYVSTQLVNELLPTLFVDYEASLRLMAGVAGAEHDKEDTQLTDFETTPEILKKMMVDVCLNADSILKEHPRLEVETVFSRKTGEALSIKALDTSGSTAIIVLVTALYVAIANAGDCRAVMGSRDPTLKKPHSSSTYMSSLFKSSSGDSNDNDDSPRGNNLSCASNGSASGQPSGGKSLRRKRSGSSAAKSLLCLPLSRDHKPSERDEKERIIKAGALCQPIVREDEKGNSIASSAGIPEKGVPYEIKVPACKQVKASRVSRGFGDFWCKQNEALPPEQQAVTAMPEVLIHPRSMADVFIVMGCDGVWDVMSSQAVVDFMSEKLGYTMYGDPEGGVSDTDAAAACDALLEECLARGAMDNLSVVLIILGSPTARTSAAPTPKDGSNPPIVVSSMPGAERSLSNSAMPRDAALTVAATAIGQSGTATTITPPSRVGPPPPPGSGSSTGRRSSRSNNEHPTPLSSRVLDALEYDTSASATSSMFGMRAASIDSNDGASDRAGAASGTEGLIIVDTDALLSELTAATHPPPTVAQLYAQSNVGPPPPTHGEFSPLNTASRTRK